MIKTTIDGITYIPVFHDKVLTLTTGKCDRCVGEYRARLCTSLPQCWDNKHSCHFIKEIP